MIVRAPRPTSHFTILPNQVLRDHRLSWKARGLLAYLLSMPDMWRTNSSHLAKAGPDGREAVRTALAELEQAGYLRRERRQGTDGRWTTTTYVFDTAQDTVHDTVDNQPVSHTPTCDYPTPVKPTLIEETSRKYLVPGSARVLHRAGPRLCERCHGSGRTVTGLGNVLPCSTCHGGGTLK